jgi:hypothetical protein
VSEPEAIKAAALLLWEELTMVDPDVAPVKSTRDLIVEAWLAEKADCIGIAGLLNKHVPELPEPIE